jgi:gas vesicle protein
MNLGKVLLGIVAGAAVGAAVGVLFAPKKGSVTRRYVSKKGKEYAGELEEKFSGLIESVNEKIESVKEETARLVKSGKIKAEEVEVKLKNTVN